MDRSLVMQGWLCVLWMVSPVVGQVEIDITHSYPFTTAHAVVSDQNGTNPVIYEAAGGGVFVLDGTQLSPSLKSGVGNQLRAGGLVRDLAMTEDHLYAAAHRGGLVRFRRDSTDNEVEWRIESDGEPLLSTHPWSIAVPIQVESEDPVFVGTNDDYYSFDSASGGSLHLMHADASSEPLAAEHHATTDLGAAIYTLATMVDGNIVTLLVGTACREVSGTYASVLRYDFDVTNGLPETFPSPTTWNPMVGCIAVPTFVRDIVIDAEAQFAYVAAYTRGVYKLDISSGLATASGDWPILAGEGTRSQFNALALYDGPLGHVLAVGRGPQFHEETTVWGSCQERGSAPRGEDARQAPDSVSTRPARRPPPS